LRVPSIILTAQSSDSGKTLISSSLAYSLKRKGKRVATFKVGPDFIDPQYLSLSSESPSYNLDPWIMGNDGVIKTYSKATKGVDFSIIEGVMGVLDGHEFGSSSLDISSILGVPIIFVVDCSKTYASAVLPLLGLRSLGYEVGGVIINKVSSEGHYKLCKEPIERYKFNVLGYLPNLAKTIPSRHLGLVTVNDNKEAKEVIEIASKEMQRTIDFEKLLEIANTAKEINYEEIRGEEIGGRKKALVAYDNSFSFYYQDNLDFLKEKGFEVEFFSILLDDKIHDADLIYIGGGYPELHLRELETAKVKDKIRKMVYDGIPLIAECGGLIYLSKEVIGLDNKVYKLSGLLDLKILVRDKLKLSYTELESIRDNLIGSKGKIIRGHEFHISRALPERDLSYAFKVRRGYGINGYDGILVENSISSYSHFMFRFTEIGSRLLKTGKK
jgi:cobyrinic acid a,c-diamide synthase